MGSRTGHFNENSQQKFNFGEGSSSFKKGSFLSSKNNPSSNNFNTASSLRINIKDNENLFELIKFDI